MAMRYALERHDKLWSQHFRAIMNTNPFTVSEAQLCSLYNAIKAELWPESPPPAPADEEDPILFVVWFCRGVPAIVDIVGTVTEHLGQEYTWTDYARLMRRVLDQEESNPLERCDSGAFRNPDPAPIELRHSSGVWRSL